MATAKTRFHVLVAEDAKTALVGFSHIGPNGQEGDIAGVDVSADQLDRMADGMKERAAEMRETQKELARAAAAKTLLQ